VAGLGRAPTLSGALTSPESALAPASRRLVSLPLVAGFSLFFTSQSVAETNCSTTGLLAPWTTVARLEAALPRWKTNPSRPSLALKRTWQVRRKPTEPRLVQLFRGATGGSRQGANRLNKKTHPTLPAGTLLTAEGLIGDKS
jgi:hypothetical protein